MSTMLPAKRARHFLRRYEMTIAQCRSARHKNYHRYKKPHIARTVAESIMAERMRAMREMAAKKRKKN